jgi:CHAT domain-containing protein/tetratricopeptide (TPR) repeat protein
MVFYRKFRLSILVLSTLTLISVLPLSGQAAAGQSGEEDEVRAVVEKFFAAFQKKDVGGLMALWSEKAPDLAAAKQSLQQILGSVERIEMKSLTFAKIKLSGEKASTRAVLETTAVSTKTGKTADGFGRLSRSFELIKETGVWRIWRYQSSEEELAARIALANTDEERRALIRDNKEFVTLELDKALLSAAGRVANQGDPARASGVYHFTEDVAAQLDDQPAISAAVRGVGMVHSRQGRYDQALECFQRSLVNDERIGNRSGAAFTLGEIGVVYYFRGSYAEALEYYQRSLAIRTDLGNKSGIARVMNDIGIVLNILGRYQEALQHYQDSLRIKEEIGDRLGISVTMVNIGTTYQQQGDYSQALSYLQQGLKIAEEMGYKSGIASALNDIAILYGVRGDYVHALECYLRSLRIAEEMGDKQGAQLALGNIGSLYDSQSNYTQALEYFQRSLSIAQETGDKGGASLVLNYMAETLGNQGNYSRALDYCERSLKIGEEIGNKARIATSLNNMAAISANQGNAAKALELGVRSLKIREDMGYKAGIAQTLSLIGEAYNSRREYESAERAEERSASVARQIGALDLLAAALTQAGKAYEGMGRPDRARDAFAGAISAVEELRNQVAGAEEQSQRFLRQRIAPYYAIAELSVVENDAASAFAFAEQAKARVLLDVLQRGRANISKAMTEQQKKQERKLNAELVSLNVQLVTEETGNEPNEKRLAEIASRLDKSRLEFESFQTNLYIANPELRVQRARLKPISVEECNALIPDSHTAVLEFLVADAKTFLFLVTRARGGQRIPDLKVYAIDTKRKDLAELIEQFRQRLANRDPSYDEPASKLYDLLLKPAASRLRGKASLVIVPDGPLWDLPFQALKLAPNRFLVQDFAVSLAPSLTALREMARKKSHPNGSPGTTLLAMGNPSIGGETSSSIKDAFMDAKLGPLPQAEQQVASLRSLYGDRSSKVYVGADATEDRLKAEAAGGRILHLATHGIVNDASPMYSQIILARGKDSTDDGILEAWEIMDMDLNADLVVLAACDTARGRVSAGEGMIGLSWAFFVAGCPSTLVSQWSVEAASTTDLMLEFHRNLRAGVAKPEALRRAELKMLKSGGKQALHPFYWAGFVVIGDPAPIAF